jgi:hypothetical protein
VLLYCDVTREEYATECDLTMDEDSTTTTVISNQNSRQCGQSSEASGLISSLSTARQRLAETDLEREHFTSKQRSMGDSISSAIQSVSRLYTDVLGVRTDMNALSDRLTAQIQQLVTIVQAMSKPDLPRKQQQPHPRASPTGLTLQYVQVMTKTPPPPQVVLF